MRSFLVFVLCLTSTVPALAAPRIKNNAKAPVTVPAEAAVPETPETGAAKPQNNGERYENLALFQKVLFFVEQNYVEDIKTKDLIYGAIRGMMDTLDPHSNFLPPEVFRDMKIDTSGKFGGIGIEIGLKEGLLTVVSPIEDTPAFKAGIKAGDKILKINGDSTKGLSLAEAVTKMRGNRGSDVLLTIMRDGVEKPREFKITRSEIKIQTVKSEDLEPHYIYVRLTNFNERSAIEVKKVIEGAEKQGKLQGLVLDLRNNPGGLLDQAVDVASLFVDEGIVVSTMGRNKDSKDVRYAKKGMAHKDVPVAVLVNGASASASEIVAGALQDHKRAVVMGQPTFGKGSVQQVVELSADVGLKLTIARYYTPTGRSIQLKGIQPDIVLEDLDQKMIDDATRKGAFLREKDLKRHMGEEDDVLADAEKKEDKKKEMKEKKDDPLKPFVAKEDYQVRQALNYLKGYRIFRAAELHGTESTPTLKSEAAPQQGQAVTN